MDSNEPIEQRQFGSVHNGSARKACSVATARALPLIAIILPIMMCTATFGTDHAIVLA